MATLLPKKSGPQDNAITTDDEHHEALANDPTVTAVPQGSAFGSVTPSSSFGGTSNGFGSSSAGFGSTSGGFGSSSGFGGGTTPAPVATTATGKKIVPNDPTAFPLV